MPDYPKYAAAVGVSNRQMINTIKRGFPRYEKPTHTMVCNPAKYGVQLCPEAEKTLLHAFGSAPGLSITDSAPESVASVQKAKVRKPENRRNNNRLCVRLNDELYSRVMKLMEKLNYTHAQDFLEQTLAAMVAEDEK